MLSHCHPRCPACPTLRYSLCKDCCWNFGPRIYFVFPLMTAQILFIHRPGVSHLLQERITCDSVMISLDCLGSTDMGFYGDFFPKVICDPWSMFVTFFVPHWISTQIISKLIIFPCYILHIKFYLYVDTTMSEILLEMSSRGLLL